MGKRAGILFYWDQYFLLLIVVKWNVFCVGARNNRKRKSCLHVFLTNECQNMEDFFMRVKNRKPWPAGCLWPEPYWDGEGDFWDLDLAEMLDLDEEGQELLDIKEYMDALVEIGRLNPDYSLNEDYEDDDREDAKGDEASEDDADEFEDDEDDGEFIPKIGTDYWDEGFDIEGWEADLTYHINQLKIGSCDSATDPVSFVRQVTGYSFINENLLRQAFTRRAFGIEYGLGDCEELEFYGDSILQTVVTLEMFKQFSDPDFYTVEQPFRTRFPVGELTTMRSKFISRDHLAARASELGLDKYILYGSGEEPSDSAREDMMEALLGAVAADSNWDWSWLADVADRLLRLQLDKPDELVKKSAYELLNSWHQKHFGSMPGYTVDRHRQRHGEELYSCVLRYQVPENDKGIRTAQMIVEDGAPTRSSAREAAAEKAVHFLRNHGLWIRLDDAHLVPELENSINQLQELYQKKYLEKAPLYTFEESTEEWTCDCSVDGIKGWGRAAGKKAAKKKAAFMVLVRLMQSAGLGTEEMEKTMWENLAR